MRNLLLPVRVLGVLALAAPSASAARLEITVRDSATGYGVPARVLAGANERAAGRALLLDAAARGRFDLPAGAHFVEARATGYRPLRARFDLSAETTLSTVLWLDPAEPPVELRAENVRALARPGHALVHGHVADVQSGRPVRGAHVRLERAGLEADTDARGYFVLDAPAPAVGTDELPPTEDLTVEQPGYRTYHRSRFFLTEGATHFIVDLERGQGSVERGVPHKMQRSPEELGAAQSLPPAAAAASRTLPLGPAAAGVAVPDSIRVGFNCSCATCSTVQVFTLDTYTRLGLDDEWISSWTANSLRAGAIAFRSYGAYHVYHPRAANYDICSTTCCQVIDPADSSVNTDNATAFTTGMIVVNATQTEPLFAEYAAENNDNFCADGFTGSPSMNWPCMSDAVDAGSAFNGHGRGECQWGTQRWSANQGKDYVWITNHYYNDNGNPSGARNGILQTPGPDFTLGASPSSRTVVAGVTAAYTVTVTGVNGFADPVGLTASGLPTGATASFDPASVTGSGTSNLTVTTAASTPPGSYTITVTGTSATLAHATTVVLAVTGPGDFAITATPASRTVTRGGSASYTATVTPSGGFTGVVSFSLTGLPAGASASFNPASVNTAGSSTLTVTTARNAARGTFTLTISGTGGGHTHAATVSLTVTK
jgi:hypothetical protein